MRLFRRAAARGFTLLELIIALTLSTFVLIGIISVATSMVKYQLQMGLHGSAGGGTLLALGQMQKQMENTSYLDKPAISDGATGFDYVRGCTNWSQLGGAALDSAAGGTWPCSGGQVTAYAYCVDASHQLWLHYNCFATGANACTTNMPGITGVANCGTNIATKTLIVGAKPGVYHREGYSAIFYRVGDNTGVDMHFIVGYSTATAGTQMPAFYRVDTRVFMEKSYPETSD